MKTITAAVAAMLLSLTVQAQETAKPAKQAGYWTITPHLAMGSTSYLNPDLPGNITTLPGFAFQIGGDIGYMLNPHVEFFTGLQYTINAYGIKFNQDDVDYRIRQRTGYLEVPVYVRVITSKPRKVGFILEGGLTAGVLLGVKNKLKGTDASGYSEQISSTDREGLNTIAAAGTLFLGVKIPVSEQTDILAGLDNQYYFTRLGEDADVQENLLRGGFRIAVNVKL